jgi:hypothetical protein
MMDQSVNKKVLKNRTFIKRVRGRISGLRDKDNGLGAREKVTVKQLEG